MTNLCCPFCGGALSVYKTITGKTSIRRIRHCDQCGSDSETVEAFAKAVTKRIGKRKPKTVTEESLSPMTTSGQIVPADYSQPPHTQRTIPESL